MAEPVLVKRYANRKLYNTETSRYITLRGIQELIEDGREVRVVDNESGEDITSVALSQILVDSERTRSNVPGSVLSELISKGGDALYTALRKPLDGAKGGVEELCVCVCPGHVASRRQRRSRTFLSRRRLRARLVATPSATSVVPARMLSMFSPWPSRIPTCRLRESGPKHVPKVSPTPERPKTVDGSPPIITTTRRISERTQWPRS